MRQPYNPNHQIPREGEAPVIGHNFAAPVSQSDIA
jgi:hypothetical protein